MSMDRLRERVLLALAVQHHEQRRERLIPEPRDVHLVEMELMTREPMHPRDEYRLCREEYDALYRAHGERARGMRRGLRFRMAELAQDPRVNERGPMRPEDYVRERASARACEALGAIGMVAGIGAGYMRGR